ncbi:MAG: hypothetical protein IT318_03805, partial [Anaerolineales bacterium]|nr:hypothetical protein [Anaerolineales bacterium]
MQSFRRWTLVAASAAAIALLGALRAVLVVAAPVDAPAGNSLGVSLSLFAQGLSDPVDIAFTGVPGDTRMFVVERDG